MRGLFGVIFRTGLVHRAARLFAVLMLLTGTSCGIKASPRPPERVRAAPVAAEATAVTESDVSQDLEEESIEEDPEFDEDPGPFDEETIF